MKYCFIEAPISCGSPSQGAEFAYESLVENGLSQQFPNCRLFPMSHPIVYETVDPKLRHLETVIKVNKQLYENCLSAYRDRYFPVVIGGDHSIFMGSFAAASETYGINHIACVYIDAHTDINTERTTITGNIHGMPVAQACGFCTDDLMIGPYYQHLYPSQIHYIGTRSTDPAEETILKEHNIHCIRMPEIKEKGISTICSELLPLLDEKQIYISLDMDALDPYFFSSTGLRIPNGLLPVDIEAILQCLFSTQKVIAMDIVEYNPTLDKTGKDRNIVFSFLNHLPH